MNRIQFILNKISQESSELIKDATKTAMYGLSSFDPNDPDQKSNIECLVEEFHDVIAAFELLMDEINIHYEESEGHFAWSRDFIQQKKEKTLKSLEVCKNIGTTFNNPVEQVVTVKESHCCNNCKSVNCNGSCGCSCDVELVPNSSGKVRENLIKFIEAKQCPHCLAYNSTEAENCTHCDSRIS